MNDIKVSILFTIGIILILIVTKEYFASMGFTYALFYQIFSLKLLKKNKQNRER